MYVCIDMYIFQSYTYNKNLNAPIYIWEKTVGIERDKKAQCWKKLALVVSFFGLLLHIQALALAIETKDTDFTVGTDHFCLCMFRIIMHTL